VERYSKVIRPSRSNVGLPINPVRSPRHKELLVQEIEEHLVLYASRREIDLQEKCLVFHENSYARKLIHEIAENLGLVHESYGVDPDRYLMVRRKPGPLSPISVVHTLSWQHLDVLLQRLGEEQLAATFPELIVTLFKESGDKDNDRIHLFATFLAKLCKQRADLKRLYIPPLQRKYQTDLQNSAHNLMLYACVGYAYVYGLLPLKNIRYGIKILLATLNEGNMEVLVILVKAVGPKLYTENVTILDTLFLELGEKKKQFSDSRRKKLLQELVKLHANQWRPEEVKERKARENEPGAQSEAETEDELEPGSIAPVAAPVKLQSLQPFNIEPGEEKDKRFRRTTTPQQPTTGIL